MNKQVLYTLGFLLFGCAQGIPIHGNKLDFSDQQDTEANSNAQQEESHLPEMPVCGPTLAVPEPLMDLVGPAAARWEAATGCSIKYSPEGIPVHTVSDLFDAEGKVIWGDTRVHTVDGKFSSCTSVTVSLKARDLAQTFTHELGHCWGATGGIDGGGHTADGIMKAWHRPEEDGHINADALELICANVPCLAFITEL